MRTLKNAWLRIPRSLRAVLNMVLICILIFCIWFARGKPGITLEGQYRRSEKANMVGPAQILDQIDAWNLWHEYDNLILAETSEGVILWADAGIFDPQLCYHEKTGDMTLLAAPCTWGFWEDASILQLPVYLVDSYPQATRAELRLSIGCVYDESAEGETALSGTPFEKTYFLESSREADGFFRFMLNAEGARDADGFRQDLGAEGYALAQLSKLTGCFPGRNDEFFSASAAVRLYNGNTLIAYEQLILAAPAEDTK